jgi:hypothetical protein
MLQVTTYKLQVTGCKLQEISFKFIQTNRFPVFFAPGFCSHLSALYSLRPTTHYLRLTFSTLCSPLSALYSMPHAPLFMKIY